MFSSLTLKRTFVLLTLCSLVAAHDLPSALHQEAATDGIILSHLFPACNGRFLGGKKPLHVPVDRCLTTHGLGMEVKTAAVCANGTRAQWARFSDSMCGNGTVSSIYGLVDLTDGDIGKCLSTGQVSSMSFWCDGVKISSPKSDDKEKDPDDKPKSKAGSVSESACMPGGAPFFNHPKTDTCVNLGTSRLKIHSAGVCANGTQSTLALYEQKDCLDAPAEFKEIKEADTKSCMDLTGTSSFAFYCTGEGMNPPLSKSPSKPGENRQSGGIVQFLLVLSLICLMFFLILVVTTITWVRRYGGSVGKLIGLVKEFLNPNKGAIAI